MPVQLATIKNVSVVQDDDGRVHWASGAAVDADGSNGQNGIVLLTELTPGSMRSQTRAGHVAVGGTFLSMPATASR